MSIDENGNIYNKFVVCFVLLFNGYANVYVKICVKTF